MDRSKRSLEQFKAPDDLVDKLLDTLLIFKRSNLRNMKNTCTVNGFQTVNIFSYSFTKEIKEQLLKLIKMKCKM